ncbi:hypothetical protein [Lederbergia galactosidilytica]|uniref:Uncharacterized protein n=1 Tax=Lederbergia galactosidilytica TaxID=217031 RepID=A0A177ZQE3_9BACI|nr:hypothetical protein [Lederbergia galactosidilytica]OAK70065.1 hypothetical protein ABB05_12845 [Lederbergia galactosidilytica]
MINHLIDQLVIVINQYRIFGGEQYERQFETLLSQLEKATGLDRDGAIKYLENAVEGERVA